MMKEKKVTHEIRKTLSKNIEAIEADKSLVSFKVNKEKGFSLPSVIVGSIIAAVLGGMALSSMWGSVDKATISAEGSSIAEVKTVATGVIEDLGSFPSELKDSADNFAAARVSQLPKELHYQLVALDADGDAATKSDIILGLKAYAKDTQGAERLKAMVDALDKKFDGVAGKTTGKFIYDDTCSTPDATDCYYVTAITSKTGKMLLDSAKGSDGSTAISAIPDNDTSSDLTSPLN